MFPCPFRFRKRSSSWAREIWEGKRFSIRIEENRKFFFSHRLRATQRFVKYRIWIIVNRSVVKSDREEKFICQKSWKGKCQGWKWKFLDNKTKLSFQDWSQLVLNKVKTKRKTRGKRKTWSKVSEIWSTAFAKLF